MAGDSHSTSVTVWIEQLRAGDPESGIVEREVPQYTQIGNAVPPRLAYALGNHLYTLVNT